MSAGCPVEYTLGVLGGKWKTVVLAHLKSGPLRYRDLRQRLPRLSEKMLTQRLHDLEEEGLVLRQPGEDGHLRYRLTARGESLRHVLQALYDWGSEDANEPGGSLKPAGGGHTLPP